MNSGKPWGRLTGVRPTKIVHRRLDLGETPEAIQEFLRRNYEVSPEKAVLLTEVAAANRFLVPTPATAQEESRRVSLYLGIPYCVSRCTYCSFPSALLPADEGQIICLLEAIGQDIQAVVKLLSTCGMTAQSLYIGGGTPTCLPGIFFKTLLGQLGEAFDIASLKEFTIEAGRPDSINPEKLGWMRQAGVTRISVNPQSMSQITLDRIGRRHRVGQIPEAMQLAREAGFQRVNMDLIAGLPGETTEDMSASLAQVLAAAPENITVHTLALKRGAQLQETVLTADMPLPSTVQKMVAHTACKIRENGLKPYYLYRQKNSPGDMENVGYARPDSVCIYNVDMIEERRTIIGMGPSAASKAVSPEQWRLTSCHFPKDIPTYIKNIQHLTTKRDSLIRSLLQQRAATEG